MAKAVSPAEAVELARRANEARVEAIRLLAEKRQTVADARDEQQRRLDEVKRETDAQVADAERDDVRAYSAALASGWSADELRKIGFDEPDKKARVRRRSRSAQSAAAAAQE